MSGITRIKPKRLRPGAVLGLVAPAGPGKPEQTQQGIQWLEVQGFQVKLGSSVREPWGYLSGSDQCRADDLNAMFADPGIDGIICLRGGYGAMRLLELVDFACIRANPKVFTGYSDITVLHTAITQRTGLVTFHGPMAAADLGRDAPDYTTDGFLRAVMELEPLGAVAMPPAAPPPLCLYPGTAQGRLTGGNLSLLAATLGTPYEIDTRGALLCLEEIGEAPYRIDRLLTQLLLAGKLQTAAGIVVAACAHCEKEPDDSGFTLEEVLRDRLGCLGLPILYGLYFGHTAAKATLPLGIRAELDADAGRLILTEAAVTA